MSDLFRNLVVGIINEQYDKVYRDSVVENLLIEYILQKTRSANRGSKSRGSFANLYAIYVLVEDYVRNNFDTAGGYEDYEGAEYTKLLQRQRQLPFGSKLQNHALNNRVNAEFQGFFPNVNAVPILRDLETNRYWINESLLIIEHNNLVINIAKLIMQIIELYINNKQQSFNDFIYQCKLMQAPQRDYTKVQDFIHSLLQPNVDARIFEIVSYAILKYYYLQYTIHWGYKLDELNEERLNLYKTGRTNANDGGIDFVMRPLGRFFQVTETLDFRKYFLDIDKIQRYPLTFVIKSNEIKSKLLHKIREDAKKTYVVNSLVEKYLNSIEDVITIPDLRDNYIELMANGYVRQILDEILIQSQVEFNPDYEFDDEI
jgi:hypothetical protein